MYDLIIIGGGPGGYVAAEKAGAGGKSVLLIEKELLGGTCLNRGCIPTKTLLHSAKLYTHARDAARFGVDAGEASFDWTRMQAWKDDAVRRLRAGIAGTMKRRGVELVEDTAVLEGPGAVRAAGSGRRYEGRNIIVATGSRPAVPPIPGLADNPRVVDSTGLLETPRVPESLCVIGGGVIGLEFAGLFAALGCAVRVIEMQDEIAPLMDRKHAAVLRAAMKNVDFALGCRVESIDGSTVAYTAADGTRAVFEAELVLSAVGRVPNVDGIGLENAGVVFDRHGIGTDWFMRTNVPGIYAAGDVTGKSLLAHTASRMGEVAVSAMFDPPDRRQRMRYTAVPWAVYTDPEAAGVGETEAEAVSRGCDPVSATLPLTMSGRFLAEQGPRAAGSCTVVADRKSGLVLGVHLVGAGVSEIVWGAAAVIEAELTVREAREIIFPHPTVAEIIRETLWELGRAMKLD